MNCRTAERWMDRVLDEGPDGSRMAELELHLEACARCRSQWQALRAAEVALRAPQVAPVPDGLLADFRRRLAEEENMPSRPTPPLPPSPQDRRGWLRWIWPAGSVAAAGMAAAMAVSLNLQSVFQEPPGPVASRSTDSPGIGAAPFSDEMADVKHGHLNRAPSPVTQRDRNPAEPAPAAGPHDRRLRPETSSLADVDRTNRKAALPRPSGQRVPAPGENDGLAAGTVSLFGRGVQSAPGSPAPSNPAEHTETESLTPDRGEGLEGISQDKQNSQAPQDRFAQARNAVGKRLNEPRASDFARSRAANGASGLQAGADEKRDRSVTPFSATSNPDSIGSREIRPDSPAAQDPQDQEIDLGLGLEAKGLAVQQKELEVSPAVLTALQRPVEVSLRNETIREAARQLTEAADVVLQVDPRVAEASVSFAAPVVRAPLWIVLQEVAQQNQLQILPLENQLLLKPADKPAGRTGERLALTLDATPQPKTAMPPAGAVGGFAGGRTGGVSGNLRGEFGGDRKQKEPAKPEPGSSPPAVPSPAPSPAGPAAPSRALEKATPTRKALHTRATASKTVAPRREEAAEGQDRTDPQERQQFYRYFGPLEPLRKDVRGLAILPDRRVWPTAWGYLPERGFTIPPPETLPPSTPPQASGRTAAEKKGGAPGPAPARPAAKNPVKPRKNRAR